MTKKKILWAAVSSLMSLSLILAACGPASAPTPPTAPSVPTSPATPTTPAAPTTPSTPTAPTPPTAETPKYGGTLILSQATDPTNWTEGQLVSFNFLYDAIFGGDWTKGAAGGYGTSESDWTSNYDRFDHYVGNAVESYNWTLDTGKNEVTIVYHVRRGVHYNVIQGNTYSAKVNGREMTADDLAWTLNWQTHTPTQYIYLTVPELRKSVITKTGPSEVTVKFTGIQTLMPALTNLNGKYTIVRPPEVFEGNFDKWQQQIGTGPFMLQEYVPGSEGIMVRNPSYWATDPIGPGKGNQLPYIDGVRYIVLPDLSTRQAALRAGKIDQLFDITVDDVDQFRKTNPNLKELEYYGWNTTNPSIHMRVDMPPFNDIRVRQAMMYATDFQSIRNGLNKGKGKIQTYPFQYNKAYADLWIAEDDPAVPEKVRDLYVYNPTKAQQLLKEAGYPNGFKMDILSTTPQVDYVAVIKDMWAKVGVNLTLMVRDGAPSATLRASHQIPPLVTGSSNSVGRFYQPWTLTGDPGSWNLAAVNDPVINENLDKVRLLSQTDLIGAMHLMRDFTKDYILYQVYAVPAPSAPVYAMWWPWLKGYNGELVMLLGTYTRWAQWTWLDQNLRKSMGH